MSRGDFEDVKKRKFTGREVKATTFSSAKDLTLERALLRANREHDEKKLHGPVKIIMKDGKLL